MRLAPTLSLLAVVLACAEAPAPPSVGPEPAPPRSEPEPELRVSEVPPASFSDPERRAKLEAVFPALAREVLAQLEADGVPGAALGIVIDDELAWAEGFGVTSLGGDVAVDERTLFRIGSITKVFTALGIVQLRDAGALELEDPAHAHLPELAGLLYPHADARPLTLADLLRHASGLPRLGETPYWELEGGPATEAELLAGLDGLALTHAPGTRYRYSNFGYALLGVVLGRAGERPAREQLRASLLDPLAMHATTWDPSARPVEQRATGHDLDDDRLALVRVPEWSMGPHDLAGGLYSNVEELGRFAAWQLGAWPARGGEDDPILARSSSREAQTIHFTSGGDAWGSRGVGWGWHVRGACGVGRVVRHSGATAGFRAELSLLPDHGVALIVLLNSHRSKVEAITKIMLAQLRDSGGLQRRRPGMLPGLAELAAPFVELGALAASGDAAGFAVAQEGLAAAIFRERVPAPQLREELAWWWQQLGPCTLAPDPTPLSSTRARHRLRCEQGEARLELTGQGGARPRILAYELSSRDLVLPAELERAAGGVLALMQQWNRHGFDELFASWWAPAGMERFLARSADSHGACSLAAAVVTGPRSARIELACSEGPARMDLRLSPAADEIVGLRIIGREARSCP